MTDLTPSQKLGAFAEVSVYAIALLWLLAISLGILSILSLALGALRDRL